MPFPVDETDRLLTTTRAVRRRLDLDRPVPVEVLLECIDVAEQAPTGGNQSSRRWLVIRDPETKAALADLYRSAGGNWITDAYAKVKGTGHHNESAMRSADYLARNLERVPAIVLATIYGIHDGTGRPGLDNIFAPWPQNVRRPGRRQFCCRGAEKLWPGLP